MTDGNNTAISEDVETIEAVRADFMKWRARAPGATLWDAFQAGNATSGQEMAAHPVGLTYPDELTPAVRSVLSMMCFEFIDLARLFRDSGFQIETSAEAEQAFFLHRLLKLALTHGDDWRKAFATELEPLILAVRAAKGGTK